ncbi:hypothetical protein B6D08_04435 [Gilliamella apicola]|uniref:Uncharacterized protein n=1 Tax=Gilliamella apicola TaxID=1196095 RepID=A0A242NJ26_9GAMM|nr:hypothetical protein B5S40_01025 [Gilliamella apicola]OTP85785.1 hypothetical protein B5S44_03835 [Gilliamella apicola]OTP91673.1 hypothetical protein B5S42_01655 [Gilliamella apicola]OTQ00368.1 hypothetical protein B6D08_04435 [Gilliamella apicola]OTQ11992.1 hypothetical protein B6C91_00455 [Gilliamella apicola]
MLALKKLWTDFVSASSLESNSLISNLISAVITQITATVREHSIAISGVAKARLFTPNPIKANGILYGPSQRLKQKNRLF